MPHRSLRAFVNKWTRRVHRWGAIASLVPLMLVVSTGILLLLKKQLAFVQPPTVRRVAGPPKIDLHAVLASASSVPGASISSWADVDRLDYRLRDGTIKVQSKNRWEVQVCMTTGEVLHAAYRRSDLIESLHDGSWFHPWAKLGVFLPNALILLGLLGTGGYLWALPIWSRRRGARVRGTNATRA
ncbi:MAG: PepSY domain-containing protein [Phycisphaerales bacterium]